MAYQLRRADTAFSNDRASKKDKRIEDQAHLAFIRKLPSVVSGQWPTEACHIRAGSPVHRKKRTGMGQKPDDCWTLPLTQAEHREQHSENEMAFWRKYGIDPFELALRLYDVSGNADLGTQIVRSARSRPGWIAVQTNTAEKRDSE